MATTEPPGREDMTPGGANVVVLRAWGEPTGGGEHEQWTSKTGTVDQRKPVKQERWPRGSKMSHYALWPHKRAGGLICFVIVVSILFIIVASL